MLESVPTNRAETDPRPGPRDSHGPVVVGLDGSVPALQALDWAADHAIRRGRPLLLVHVRVAVRHALGGDAVGVFRTAAARLAERGHGDLQVSTVVRDGRVTDGLLEEAAPACLLVVGREGVGRMAGLVFGSTSRACAARARIPVVVIPGLWQPDERRQRVVVGVDADEKCDDAIEYAFEAADERGAPLLAVHTWSLPARPPAGVPMYDVTQRLESQGRRTLAAALAPIRGRYPRVAVTEVVEFGEPATALRLHSVDADLVVIGGVAHGTIGGLVLGSEAGAVLRRVPRPIAVVHQGTRPT